MKAKSKSNILFIYKDYSNFVKKDLEILAEYYPVDDFRSDVQKSFVKFVSAIIHDFFFLLLNIYKYKAVYIWFSDYHSFLPVFFAKLFHKKSFLVLGGYDVTYIPEFQYGSFSNPLRSFCARYSMENSTLNLAVSENLIDEAKKRTKKGSFKLLPTGYEPEIYKGSIQNKQNIILTVSQTSTEQRFKIKGLDRFIELASICPEYQFVVIGVMKSAIDLFEPKPENLKLLPSVKHEELFQWYNKAKFYAQFSRSEGLPNSVCESMLFNCIPLGINVGGIGFAMGDVGILLDKWDSHEMKQKISSLTDYIGVAERARENIIDRFNIKSRKDFLSEIIN